MEESMLTTSLTGRSVLVTGGSKGIGKGIARVFARAGAKVLIVARRLDVAEATARELAGQNGTVSATAADVTDLSEDGVIVLGIPANVFLDTGEHW